MAAQGKLHSDRSDLMAYWVTVKPKGFCQTSSIVRVRSGWKANMSVAVKDPSCAPCGLVRRFLRRTCARLSPMSVIELTLKPYHR